MLYTARIAVFCTVLLSMATPSGAFPAMSGIASIQRDLRGLPIGERIARWSENFIGTPYDPDPLGAYVTSKAIVADSQVDCMYLAFRSVELARTLSPESAVEEALDLRFQTRGELAPDGTVANYEERYQYAMDMIAGGKWGKDITAGLGATGQVPGDRGHGQVIMLPAGEVRNALKALKSGDIVFFIKDPAKRVVGEIVGHIGILKLEAGLVFLIHASGKKSREGKRGGQVVKLPFAEYAEDMPFKGVIITRFQ